jgi:hypothetical protein
MTKNYSISSSVLIQKCVIITFMFLAFALQRTNTENSEQIFPEKELQATVPIFTFMCL